MGRARIIRRARGDPTILWGPLVDFQARYQKCQERSRGSRRALGSLVRSDHFHMFGVYPTPGTPHALVKARIMYHLQFEGFRKAGRERQLSSAFLQDHRAAMQMRKDLEGFTEETAFLLRLSAGEEADAGQTDAKRNGRKARKLSARRVVYDLYWRNNDAKLSDLEIQRRVVAMFPKSRSYKKLSNVRRSRTGVNKGRHRNGPPPQPILEYDEDGKVVLGKTKPKRRARRIG